MQAELAVLLVEDEAHRVEWFQRAVIAAGATRMTWAQDVPTAIARLQNTHYDFLFLDHDLGTEPAVGRDVARWLIDRPGEHPQVVTTVHSMNVVSAPKIVRELLDAHRRASWVPFSALVARGGLVL